jgi:HEAT repeat protein
VLEGALEDRDREMSITAAQSLARFEDSRTAARVFDMATRETLLGRILLAGPLRPHAQDLCQTAVAAAFEAPEPERVLAALQIVAAWERALPLPGLEKLLLHNDRAVRLQALRVVALSLPTPGVETAVAQCLSDDDAEIASAAAQVAGRLRLHSTLPLLEKHARSGNPALANEAATAIAALKPPQVRRTGAA